MIPYVSLNMNLGCQMDDTKEILKCSYRRGIHPEGAWTNTPLWLTHTVMGRGEIPGFRVVPPRWTHLAPPARKYPSSQKENQMSICFLTVPINQPQNQSRINMVGHDIKSQAWASQVIEFCLPGAGSRYRMKKWIPPPRLANAFEDFLQLQDARALQDLMYPWTQQS